MTPLLSLGLSNLAVATVLAVVACCAGWCWRRPALTHGLWLLVFLKLLTPPLVSIPVIRTTASAPAPTLAAAPVAVTQQPATPPQQPAPHVEPQPEPPVHEVADVVRSVNNEQPRVLAPEPQEQQAEAKLPLVPVVVVAQLPVEPVAPALPATETLAWEWSWLPTALGWTWLTGASLWFTLAAYRLIRFQRLLRFGQPATAELRALANDVAARMEVRCPQLVLVPGAVSPMLWVFGRALRLVLPITLVERLTPEQWRTLLAHELAHWRRRDHWVRWLELAVLGLYWWCPLVWWAKRNFKRPRRNAAMPGW